jgi:protein TonB
MKEFADVDDIARANPEGGDGEDFGGMGDGDGEAIEFIEPDVEEDPDMFEFFEGENPDFDLAELQRMVVYPELAKRAGIEGKVVIMALVSTDGTVVRDSIVQSDSDMLNQAAKDALYKLSDSGQISPGISSDGEPARAWLTIPITFRLR